MRKVVLTCVCLLILAVGGSHEEAVAGNTKNRVERNYYHNGQLRTEIRYKNGLRISRRTFTKEGKIFEESRYKGGQLYYKRTSYPDGRVRTLWNGKNGRLVNYDPNGRIKSVSRTKVNGPQAR